MRALTFTSSTDTKLKLVPEQASPVASVALIGTNSALSSPRTNGLEMVGSMAAAAAGRAVPLAAVAAAATRGRAAGTGSCWVVLMVEALKVGGLVWRPGVAAGCGTALHAPVTRSCTPLEIRSPASPAAAP